MKVEIEKEVSFEEAMNWLSNFSEDLPFPPESVRADINVVAKYPALLYGFFEGFLYHFSDNLSEDYDGGFWVGYKLTNGGYFVTPSEDKKFNSIMSSNGNQAELNNIEFGLTCSYMCLNIILNNIYNVNQNLSEELAEKFYILREFALNFSKVMYITD